MQRDTPLQGRELALVRLPARMRRALRLFRQISGQTAVMSVTIFPEGPGRAKALAPPVHPTCARRLRAAHEAPCHQQWRMHLRSCRRSARTVSHTCPIGLRCACVPVQFDGRLIGIAKLVVDARTSDAAFSAGIRALRLVVSEATQDALSSALTREIEALRQTVAGLRRINSMGAPLSTARAPRVALSRSEEKVAANSGLVDRALDYLQEHFQDPKLSLKVVARELSCNPRYMTTRFTRIVGERMHGYLLNLRVAHACRLLLGSGSSVKEIAYASGFLGPSRLARAFRRYVGVSPREYRRIFSAP